MDQESAISVDRDQEPFSIGEFRPEDAEGIVRLFLEIYGEGYPIRLFYDPEAVIAANRDGEYISIVARTDSGKVIGVNHLFHSAPFRGLYETGVGLVSKQYRNSGANKRMLTYLYETVVPAHPHMEQLFGQPVCNHVFMQKTVESLGFRETGIEVALMPAEAFSREKSATGRVATLNTFRCYVPKPHRIFLPESYQAILRRIYDRLGDGRDFAPCRKIRDGEKTQSEGAFFDFAGVARFGFLKVGADFANRLNELEEQASSKGMVVFQASLNMNDACVGEAVDILRERGYFFGGALPRWFDTDGLLMQKLACQPDFEGIELWSDFAKELLAFIREDRERVR